MPLTTRFKIDLAFSIALLILLAGGIASYQNVRRLRAHQDQVERAQRVLTGIAEIGSLLKDAETGQRGYLLTGREDLLEPYHQASAALGPGLASLRRIVGEPAQRENLRRLELLARTRLVLMDSALDLAHAGDREAAVRLVREGSGPGIMNEVRAEIRRMEAHEFALFHLWQTRESVIARQTIGLILVASFLAVGIVGVSRQGVIGELRARERAESALRESEQRYRRLAEASLEGIVLLERDRIADANPVAAELLGLEPGELVGREMIEFVAPESFEMADSRFRDDSEEPYELTALRADGTRVYLEARGRATTHEGRPARIVALRDVTQRRRAEQAIRESEERYRRLVEASLEGIVLSQDQRIVDANPAYCEMVGLPLDEILGRDPLSFVAPESIPVIGEALRTGTAEPYEVVGLHPDGTRYSLEARGRAITYRGREARITAVLDVTHRRRAEQAIRESQERFRSLVEAASDVIYRADTAGFFTYVNPTAVQILGYPERELLGMRLARLVREDARAEVEDFFVRQLRDELPVTYHEFPAVTADGREVWIGQNVRLLREGGRVVGVQAVARDISRQREMERMKDEFLSVVSHELRTPLTAIRGSLGLLASGKMGRLEERGQRMLEIAAQNTDRLVFLINDLLDLEKIQSGKVTMERRVVDSAELVRRAAESVTPLAERAGVRIVLSAPSVELRADPDRMDQVLTNLLSNAIKFSPEGAAVEVGGERRDREMLLWVRDRGRGVPADKLELIFERFQQVDSSDARQKGGTGLGLPIARSIMELHGGRVWAESRWGEGSTFYLSLPLPDAEPAAEPDARLALVCDDDPGVAAFVEAALSREGWSVVRAETGEVALRLARERRPAVILLDLVLPRMSGREVLEGLRADPATASVPVVVLTGAGDDSELDLASIVGWLEKPIERSALLRAVEWATDTRKEECHVLVVEDDEDVAGVIAELLRGRGLRSCHARSGREAIELSRRLSYDLLLLDPGLPDIDGFGLVDWLRRHNRHRNVPVLVHTARELDDADRDRLRLGPTEFLVKTRVTPDELERRIVALLGAAGNRRATER